MEYNKIHMLYLGMVKNDEGYAHQWVKITAEDNNGQPLPGTLNIRHYDVKPRKGFGNNIAKANPGSIYEFDETVQGTVLLSDKYLGRWFNETEVVLWSALHDALDSEMRMLSCAQKESTRKHNLEALEPFRAAYKAARGVTKRIMLAEIVAYISGR